MPIVHRIGYLVYVAAQGLTGERGCTAVWILIWLVGHVVLNPFFFVLQ